MITRLHFTGKSGCKAPQVIVFNEMYMDTETEFHWIFLVKVTFFCIFLWHVLAVVFFPCAVIFV